MESIKMIIFTKPRRAIATVPLDSPNLVSGGQTIKFAITDPFGKHYCDSLANWHLSMP